MNIVFAGLFSDGVSPKKAGAVYEEEGARQQGQGAPEDKEDKHMAQVTKRTNKKGASYLIRVSAGYGPDGKQVKKSMTWTPPEGMGEGKAAKEAARQAVLFEEAVRKGGAEVDGRVKFAAYADKWMRRHVRPNLRMRTAAAYAQLLPRINDAIGHLRLCDIKPAHLNQFYAALQEPGANARTGGGLAPGAVAGYHREISAVLSYAVKEGLIDANPASRAAPPKGRKAEAAFLDENDARRVMKLLHGEPAKYRAALTFCLLSGLRRGEVLGLRWRDVDFGNETITVCQTSAYIPGKGLVVDEPKNETSARPLKLSKTAFALLREHGEWQGGQKEACGSHWKDRDGRVFTHEDGRPIAPGWFTEWFTEFAERSGYPGIHVHSLRHSYASLEIAEGTPLVVVSRRLGHAQVSTTANIYAHMIRSAEEKASRLGDRFADVVTAPAAATAKPKRKKAV